MSVSASYDIVLAGRGGQGVIFLSSNVHGAEDVATNFGPEMSALANCFKGKLGDEKASFIYTIPSKALAPKITAPKAIKGNNTAVEISDWSEVAKVIEAAVSQSK